MLNLCRRASFGSIAALAACWSVTCHAFVVGVDDLSVIRNDAAFFHDSFSDGVPPPSGPNGDATYNVLGSIPVESSGMVFLDSANGASNSSTSNAIEESRIEQRVRLLTNIDSSNFAAGLKSDDTISFTGVFSLTTPSGVFNPQYSIRLTDASGGGPHQAAQLQVLLNSTTGLPVVRYIFQNFDANTITVLGSALFAPPVGADEIRLNISRPNTANDNAFASFAYLSSGVSVGGTSFATAAQLFQVEDFVRAEFNVSDGVAAVPEPETYAMLLAGLGVLGWASRRRKLT